MYKRSILSSVVGIIIGAQGISNALADPAKYVLLAKADNTQPIHEVYVEKPKNYWGWWQTFQWESFFHSGVSKKELQMLNTAAEYGDSQAQYVLAMFYSSRNNQDNTLYWLEKAAKQGHKKAAFVYRYYTDPPEAYGFGC